MARNYSKREQKKIKENFLLALEKSGGIITPAAQNAKVSRQTIFHWRKEDADFNAKVTAKIEEVTEMVLDVAEAALMKNIQNGDMNAIKFYLSTKGRGRGYSLRYDVDMELSLIRPRIVYEDQLPEAEQQKQIEEQ